MEMDVIFDENAEASKGRTKCCLGLDPRWQSKARELAVETSQLRRLEAFGSTR